MSVDAHREGLLQGNRRKKRGPVGCSSNAATVDDSRPGVKLKWSELQVGLEEIEAGRQERQRGQLPGLGGLVEWLTAWWSRAAHGLEDAARCPAEKE